MQKLQIFLGLILFLAIGSIFYFTQASQKSGLIGISPTPTIDLNQPFQLISPAANAQQQQQQQTQQVQGDQTQASQQQNVAPPAQEQSPQQPLAASISAVIKTSKGDIDISLDGQNAPNTVRNFMDKAQSNFYNNLIFHRVEDWVIQGGDPNGDGTGGGQIAAEKTSAPFVVGSVGIARGSDPTINNASQFFITKTAADWLDGQYTNFGIVTSGMDVVNKIAIGDKILSITINSSNGVQSEGGLNETP